MIPWICEGIRTCFPAGTYVDFVFDNCTDSSLDNFVHRANAKHTEYGSLSGFHTRYFRSEKKHRWPNTNDAIRRFMDSPCDLFLSPQDDMKLQDKFIVQNLINLYQSNQKVGLVGMRDGISPGIMYSSNHSHQTDVKTNWLRSGEFRKVDLVNDGPICLSKEAVREIGYFNEEYWAHYTDNDYCHTAVEKGYNNFVMGAEIVHEKWDCKKCGALIQSEVWSQEYSSHDYDIYKAKWIK